MEALVALVVCALGLLGLAGSAGAYLRDFEQVRLGTPTSSSTLGGRSFQCPGGKFLIGVGGGVPNGSVWSGLALTKLWIRTTYQGNGEVGGVETDPVSAWHMAAQGYCASFTTTQPSAAPGASYVGDVEVVANESPMNGADYKFVNAGCLGRESIGGGFNIIGAGGAFGANHVTARGGFLLDGDNVDGYQARAQESDPSPSAWRLTTYAICAERGPGGRARYVGNTISTPVATSTAASIDKAVTASCPGGQRIIGGSAEVVGATDTAIPPYEVALVGSSPSGPGVNATGWFAKAFEEDPTSEPWRIRAKAVCALLVPRS